MADNGSIDGKAALGSLVEQLKLANEETLKLLSQFKEIGNAARSFKTPSQGNKVIETGEASFKKAGEATKEYTRLLKAVERQKERNRQVDGNFSRALAKERVETTRLNKENRERAILQNKAIGAYQKLNLERTKASKTLRDLIASEKASNAEIQKAQKNFDLLDGKIRKADKAVRDSTKNVGNYKSAFGGLRNTLRGLVGAFGVSSGIYLFANSLRDAFSRVRAFDKSMQNLAGILRTTRSEIRDIEDVILKVAGSSIKTSSEVAELSESLATLGKRGQELKDLIKPANDLSIALEATSDETAEFLIQSLNSFGAASSEAQDYAKVIGSIRTSTSLDFQKMRDSFQYLAPIARTLGKDLAFTGSIIGIIADSGVKAEQAGRLLGTALQNLAKTGNTLEGALAEINTAQENGIKGYELLAIASKLFGAQGAKIGVILANNSELIEINSQKIRDNGGALQDLIDEQLKSLDAQIKIRKNHGC